MSASITVGMITKDSATSLGPRFVAVLDAIRREIPHYAEVLVSDVSADDTLLTIEERLGSRVRAVGRGFTRGLARQLVIDNLRTEWLLFVDDDCLLDRGWLKAAEAEISPDVGLVWGPFRGTAQRPPPLNRRGVVRDFRRRGGTHDTLLRRDALRGIDIPFKLHYFEDAYIKRFVEEVRGYASRVSRVGCVHLKTQQEEERDTMSRNLIQYISNERMSGAYRPNPRKFFRTAIGTVLKLELGKGTLRKRMLWLRYYGGFLKSNPSFFRFDPLPIVNFLSSLKGRVCYDIGANVGFYSDIFRQHFDKVYAFEPSYVAWRALRQTPGIVPLNIAVSDSDDSLKVGVFREANFHSGQFGMVGLHVLEPTWGRLLEEQTVPSVRLDTFINGDGHRFPDLIKIDTEGFEVSILRGLGRTLRDVPRFFIEVHSRENLKVIEAMLEKSHAIKHLLSEKEHEHSWMFAGSV